MSLWPDKSSISSLALEYMRKNYDSFQSFEEEFFVG
jgi:hypothetical protein